MIPDTWKMVPEQDCKLSWKILCPRISSMEMKTITNTAYIHKALIGLESHSVKLIH